MTLLPEVPAIVRGTVVHRRSVPRRYGFRHRVYQWLVDLDDVPPRFRPEDHLDKAGVLRELVAHGIDLPDARVLMLANAPVLGHVFDPLTVFWCFERDALRCVVAEVHNTYGGRHSYVLLAGERSVGKEFYVSPFNDVSGVYDLDFSLSADAVRVRVSLFRASRRVFEASFDGVPRPATRWTVARTMLRMPLMPQRVSALIRLHGIALWLRRLPVYKRSR